MVAPAFVVLFQGVGIFCNASVGLTQKHHASDWIKCKNFDSTHDHGSNIDMGTYEPTQEAKIFKEFCQGYQKNI
jgi:hypothetical protein